MSPDVLMSAYRQIVWLHVASSTSLEHATSQLAACTDADPSTCRWALAAAGLGEQHWPMRCVVTSRGALPASVRNRRALNSAIDIARAGQTHKPETP